MVSWQGYQWSLYETTTAPELAAATQSPAVRASSESPGSWQGKCFSPVESEKAEELTKNTAKKGVESSEAPRTVKEAKGVKGGTLTYKPAGTINWGDGTASKVQGNY